MKQKTFFFLFLISTFCSAQSTGPFGIWEDQVNGGYKFVRLNAATGVKTVISNITLTGFVSGSKSAFNPHKNQYYFAGQGGSVSHFYTVNAGTGAVVRKTQISDNVVGIEYNCNDSTLYGILVEGNVYSFCKIDSITALATVIGGLNMSGYVAGSFSLDLANNRYNLKALAGGGYRMLSIDIQTGTVVYDNAFPDNVVGHRYNPADSTVYGLWEDNNVYKLEKINFTNGTHSTVGALAGVDPGYVTESHSMNESGIYTFRGFNGPAMALISVDVSNASVINMNNTSDNAVGFEEPACLMSPTAVHEIDSDNDLTIYPNPTSGIFRIESSEKILTIDVLNMIGEKIYSTTINGQSSIDLLSKPNGIYYLSAKTNYKTVNCKVIIQK